MDDGTEQRSRPPESEEGRRKSDSLMHINLPPYARCVVRATGPFSVYHGDMIVGPDSGTDRRIVLETAHDPMEFSVSAAPDTDVTHKVEVRPSRYEKNDGIPVAVQEPVSEPTIQEMMRMYLAQYVGQADPNEIETPDEFFDFGDDDMDDDHLLDSPYELMEDQYLLEEPPASTDDDSTESSAPSTEPEVDVKPQNQE